MSLTSSSQSNSFNGDVTITGNLIAHGITANGPMVANDGLAVQGGLALDSLTLGGDLTLDSAAWIYFGDPFTVGTFRERVVNGQLVRYERVDTTGVDATDWTETSKDDA